MNRVQIEIFLGTLLILATSVIVLVYGFNEQTRMAEFEQSQRGRAIETGAALFEQQCSRCHGTQGTGIPGLCPPLNDRHFFDERLKEVSWSGTLEDYIVATASSGRLASTRPEIYPGQGTPAMPSFLDRYGGPLREDQVRNIAAFIMNWEETATLVEAPSAPSGPTVGQDITKELPQGDPASGEALAASLGCTACHVAAPVGPLWPASAGQPGVGTNAAERLTASDYTGAAQTPEQYLFESIVKPSAYVVSGFADGLMPASYANSLTDQQVADLIAYLLSLK
ncbi:MAG: c-type cytochrome [Chloroflexota bacterium]